ncbi:MAG: N-acetylmuramoyl-L-alanine amidase [Oscillospiraceae bacterium]|nr:N-acetylmuramoyl-L-alanine amidase [Oscillospiraceae bacterium]
MEIKEMLIEKGRINRPGTANSIRYITIHDTANTKKGADATAHAKYLKALNSRTSWHYTVDDETIVRHLPDGEKSYHTSSIKANENSIAIELCVNEDSDFEKTCRRAVALVRELSEKYKIPPENIMTHRDWTGKTCPARLIGDGLDKFITACRSRSEERFATIDELRELGFSGIRF